MEMLQDHRNFPSLDCGDRDKLLMLLSCDAHPDKIGVGRSSTNATISVSNVSRPMATTRARLLLRAPSGADGPSLVRIITENIETYLDLPMSPISIDEFFADPSSFMVPEPTHRVPFPLSLKLSLDGKEMELWANISSFTSRTPSISSPGCRGCVKELLPIEPRHWCFQRLARVEADFSKLRLHMRNNNWPPTTRDSALRELAAFHHGHQGLPLTSARILCTPYIEVLHHSINVNSSFLKTLCADLDFHAKSLPEMQFVQEFFDKFPEKSWFRLYRNFNLRRCLDPSLYMTAKSDPAIVPRFQGAQSVSLIKTIPKIIEGWVLPSASSSILPSIPSTPMPISSEPTTESDFEVDTSEFSPSFIGVLKKWRAVFAFWIPIYWILNGTISLNHEILAAELLAVIPITNPTEMPPQTSPEIIKWAHAILSANLLFVMHTYFSNAMVNSFLFDMLISSNWQLRDCFSSYGLGLAACSLQLAEHVNSLTAQAHLRHSNRMTTAHSCPTLQVMRAVNYRLVTGKSSATYRNQRAFSEEYRGLVRGVRRDWIADLHSADVEDLIEGHRTSLRDGFPLNDELFSDPDADPLLEPSIQLPVAPSNGLLSDEEVLSSIPSHLVSPPPELSGELTDDVVDFPSLTPSAVPSTVPNGDDEDPIVLVSAQVEINKLIRIISNDDWQKCDHFHRSVTTKAVESMISRIISEGEIEALRISENQPEASYEVEETHETNIPLPHRGSSERHPETSELSEAPEPAIHLRRGRGRGTLMDRGGSGRGRGRPQGRRGVRTMSYQD